MSTTATIAAARSGSLATRVLAAARLVVMLALAGWTLYWLVAGWDYMKLHSIVVQQGFGGDGIQMWEIFNLKMVAAHHAIRWGGGALVALVALRFLRRRAPADA